jgi:hypothetical protein
VRLVYGGGNIVRRQLLRALIRDVILASASVAFVFLWMLLHTRSLFLSVAGMLHILSSFFPALLVQRLVFGKYLSMLSFVALWLILAIGGARRRPRPAAPAAHGRAHRSRRHVCVFRHVQAGAADQRGGAAAAAARAHGVGIQERLLVDARHLVHHLRRAHG